MKVKNLLLEVPESWAGNQFGPELFGRNSDLVSSVLVVAAVSGDNDEDEEVDHHHRHHELQPPPRQRHGNALHPSAPDTTRETTTSKGLVITEMELPVRSQMKITSRSQTARHVSDHCVNDNVSRAGRLS